MTRSATEIAEDFGTQLDNHRASGDSGTAQLARDAYTAGATQQQQQDAAAALNTSLEESGLLPGIDIVGISGASPDGQGINVEIAPESTAENTGVTAHQNATYNPETQELSFPREAVLLSSNGQTEYVSVNMVTGKETVRVGDENNGLITTRESVGDPACVETVIKDGLVTETNSWGNDGKTGPSRQFQYAPDGSLTGVSQDGKVVAIPEGATVNMDPNAGIVGDLNFSQTIADNVQAQMTQHPDGTTTVKMPPGEDGQPGRSYDIDSTGRIDYQVKGGDNLWSIGKDVAQLQGIANPSNEDIQRIVDSIDHVAQNGNPNLILEGETIEFGNVVNTGDSVDLSGYRPEITDEVAQPQQISSNNGSYQFGAQALPDFNPQSQATVSEDGRRVTYTNNSNQTVEVWDNGLVHTTGVQNGLYVEMYQQKDQTIRKDAEGQWWAQRIPDGASIKVGEPHQESLQHGEVRTSNGSVDYILNGESDKNEW